MIVFGLEPKLLAIQVFFVIAWTLTFVLQLVVGVAVVGWVGNFGTVERDEAPGPYWFSICLQGVAFLVSLFFAARNYWIS